MNLRPAHKEPFQDSLKEKIKKEVEKKKDLKDMTETELEEYIYGYVDINQ